MAQCLKCGKKAAEQSVFCSECLAVMEQYPVKPGTVVHIPQRQSVSSGKRQADYETIQKEQIAYQGRVIRWLTTIVAVLSILLVITAVFLVRTLENATARPMIGKNYTTSTSATSHNP